MPHFITSPNVPTEEPQKSHLSINGAKVVSPVVARHDREGAFTTQVTMSSKYGKQPQTADQEGEFQDEDEDEYEHEESGVPQYGSQSQETLIGRYENTPRAYTDEAIDPEYTLEAQSNLEAEPSALDSADAEASESQGSRGIGSLAVVTIPF